MKTEHETSPVGHRFDGLYCTLFRVFSVKVCSLTGDLCQCNYRVRLCENGEWYPISRLSRNRIAAVCDFFTFIRHVQSGLVKSDTRNRYNKIIELRKQMAFGRLGL
ncbi:unnamed protein product [Rotaria sp. Silwood2]|nr:unnamed protein product [Rotaria sp. Silwood2]CAF3883105.1 unnamed protein product [Rotaria sp. Silwood2]